MHWGDADFFNFVILTRVANVAGVLARVPRRLPTECKRRASIPVKRPHRISRQIPYGSRSFTRPVSSTISKGSAARQGEARTIRRDSARCHDRLPEILPSSAAEGLSL